VGAIGDARLSDSGCVLSVCGLLIVGVALHVATARRRRTAIIMALANSVKKPPSAHAMAAITQTEDVLVDTRGYVHVTDRNGSVWILRHRGPDQPAPTDW
jgi:hypothetical protein